MRNILSFTPWILAAIYLLTFLWMNSVSDGEMADSVLGGYAFVKFLAMLFLSVVYTFKYSAQGSWLTDLILIICGLFVLSDLYMLSKIFQ